MYLIENTDGTSSGGILGRGACVLRKGHGRRSLAGRRAAGSAVAGIAAALVAGIAGLTGGMGGASAYGQTITILQIEEGFGAGQPFYAPVEYADGQTNIADGSAFGYSGIAFNNLYTNVGNGTTTLSSHASAVANYAFGAGSLGATAIKTVYTDTIQVYNSNGTQGATPFFTDRFKLPTIPLINSPAPVLLGNNIRIVNNSYVTSFATAALNTEYVRRADFMIDRENLVWAGGAVNGGAFSRASDGSTVVPWQSRNGIAVRGESTDTPFDPRLGPTGRNHADIYDQDKASFATGRVTGASAALIQRAAQLSNTAGGDARVIKSVLMSGAGKGFSNATNSQTSGGLTLTEPAAWTPTPVTNGPVVQNNLDPWKGAGRLSYATSLAILEAGQRTYATAAGSVAGSTITAGNVPSVNAQGWSLGTVANTGSSLPARAVLVNFSGPVTALAATLNWNWTVQSTGGNINTSDSTVIQPDLSLQLLPVTWNGTQYTLGSAVAAATGRALSSDATGIYNDNVEHLYILGTQAGAAIAPGTYAFVIRGAIQGTNGVTGSLATVAALSYNATVASAPAWNLDAGGTYATGTNWVGGFSPSGASTTAVFGPAGANANNRTVTFSSGLTLGSVDFSGSRSYNLAVSGGTGNLVLNNAALGASRVTVSSGTHTISATLQNTTTATVAFSGSSTLAVTAVSNTGALAVTGAGTARFGSVSGTGGTLNVGPGATVQLSGGGNAATYANVLDQQSITLAGTSGAANKATLAITGNAIPAAGARVNKPSVITTTAVSIANSGGTYFGFLDLGGNDMVVKGGAGSLASLRAAVAAWYSGGARVAQGLGTTVTGGLAAYTTVAVFPNVAQPGVAYYETYDGVSVGTNDLIVKTTYLGDVNVDGVLDGSDLTRILEGLTTGLTGWQNGDVNYDGVVNGADLTLFNGALANQSGSLFNGSGAGAGPSGAVPEPAAMGLLLGAGVPLAARRRRR